MEESKEQQVEEETRDYEHEHHGRDRVKGTRFSSISPERALSSNNHSGVRGVCYNHSKKRGMLRLVSVERKLISVLSKTRRGQYQMAMPLRMRE